MTATTEQPRVSLQRRFLKRLSEGVLRCGMPGQKVLVGVSGGSDSVSLLRGLKTLSGEYALALHVGHVNHGLRASASSEDALWVARLCESLGIECDVKTSGPGQSDSEEMARKTRYAAFEKMAEHRRCGMIAVAHTRDDQVETVLHHVLRGTGLMGLRGMLEMHQTGAGRRLVRPLLSVSSAEGRTWLEEQKWEYREDESNWQREFTRNRIRHELLPLLAQEYNPRVVEALARLAQQAGEAQEVIDQLVDEILARSVLEESRQLVRLDVDGFIGQPLFLVREALKQLWTRLGWPRGGMTFNSWSRAAVAITEGGAVDLGAGVSLRRRGGVVVVSRENSADLSGGCLS